MGKKTKKTKWRMLEIPPLGSKTYESATTTTNSNGNANENANANGKWDEGQRTAQFASNYRYEKTCTNAAATRTTRRSSPRMNLSSNGTTTTTLTTGDCTLNPFSFISNDTFTMKEDSKTFVEDEYTKITTPRQDVLFKKGYLSKRKIPETTSDNSVDQNSDDIAQDCATNNDDFSPYVNGDENIQSFMCATPQSYIDSSALYYAGSYEIYDPFTGNVTVVMGAPSNGQYGSNNSCQPVLTSVSCRPVPLQPVQWFNPVPSSDWCCSYSAGGGPQNDKRYSTDSQNGSGMGSESSAVTESPAELIDEQMNSANGSATAQSSSFSQAYVYPGYMFGAPIYNVDGVNVQYLAPPSPTLSCTEHAAAKRRKKRKRRRRTGETPEDETESSLDDNSNHSVSSNDCILDFQSPPSSESLEYEDDVKATTCHLYDASSTQTCNELTLRATDTNIVSTPLASSVRFSTLPYSVVNAPEFVPAEERRSLKLSVTSDDVRRIANDANVVDCEKSTAAAGLNVYCKPFDSHTAKRGDSQRISSSNNSDSGISSPGSDDTPISKGDLVSADNMSSIKVEESTTNGCNGVGSNGGGGSSNSSGGGGGGGGGGPITKQRKHSRAKRSSKKVEAVIESELKKQKTMASLTGHKSCTQQSGHNAQDEKKEKAPTSSRKEESETKSTTTSKLSRGRKKFDDEFVVESVFKSGATTAAVTAKSNENKTVCGNRKKETSKSAGRCKKTSRNQSPKSDETNDTKKAGEISKVRASSNDRTVTNEQMEKCENCDSKCVDNDGDIEDDGCTRRLLLEQYECSKRNLNGRCFEQHRQNAHPLSNTETDKLDESYVVKIEQKPMLAEIESVELDKVVHCKSTSRPDECCYVTMSDFSSRREMSSSDSPTAPPRRKKPTRKCVEETAQCLVDEIIKRAEERIADRYSSMACDKIKTFQLPITQAVTKWLNEHGGLPAVSTDDESETEDETDGDRKDIIIVEATTPKVDSTIMMATAATTTTTTTTTITTASMTSLTTASNDSTSKSSETIKKVKKSKQKCVIC